MNLLAWNCQGLEVALTARNLKEECFRKKPHLVFLMETKQKARYVRKIRRRCGFDEEWIVDPIGKSGGLALWWSEVLTVNILFSSANIIHTSVMSPALSTPSYITFIHGPTDEGDRLLCWQEVRRISTNITTSWLCLGDFNDILAQEEKCGGLPKAWRKILNFKCFVVDCGLEDLSYNGPCFTWCNNRDTPDTIHERIDRAFGNLQLREEFPSLQVFNIDPARTSDHHLLFIQYHYEKYERSRAFRFEAAWASHDHFLEVIRDTWQNPAGQDVPFMDSFLNNLGQCRVKLTSWSRKEFPNNTKCINLLKAYVADLTQKDRSAEVSREILEARRELDRLLELEEQYWWQRSRINWLTAGDKNSRFFHVSTIKRRQRNRISCIKDDGGNWLMDKEAISQNVADYFQNLFATSAPNSMDVVLNYIEPKISDDMNQTLMHSISREEIKAAAFSLGSTKAPGPDGFSGKFYHSAWPEISDTVCSMVNDFFAGRSVLDGINMTNITLIPKVHKPEHVSQFRPIGLCNFSYKIISKIMANRMRPLLDMCISQNQSAFVPGRCIHDNIIIAHEVYHYLRRKYSGGKYEFALKMDMSKAYDRVEWDFIENVLLRFGFCSKWVSLVMKCVRSVSLNICLSGENIKSFLPSRGIRQGDPLSPYLFIIIAEVLSLMISKSQISKQVTGIKLSNGCPVLTHSFFADDALLYMRASHRNCTYLAKILDLYCAASGQVINLDKSSIFFSSNSPLAVRTMVCGMLHIPATEDPGTYLGIPSIWGKSKTQALAYIKERVASKIQGWSHSLLSFSGREVMIKAVIQAIPIYPMNCFKFPVKVCKEINSLIANFWWDGNAFGGKTHWKAWGTMTDSKTSGGMGFRDLLMMNDALLAKTAWRLLFKPNDLWARVIKSVYFPGQEFLDAEIGYKASWCWTSILHGRDVLRKDLRWDLGNGSAIRIWGDPWVPGDIFPKRPSSSDIPIIAEGRVCDLIVDGQWNLSPISPYVSTEVKEAIYKIPIPSNGLEDKLVWTSARDGVYSIKLGYHRRKNQNSVNVNRSGSSTVIPSKCWKLVWKIRVIPRVQQFIWRLLNDAVATNYALVRRRRSKDSRCPVCEKAEETIEHVFFHCPWTRCIWFGCSLGARVEVSTVSNFKLWWMKTSESPLLSKQDLALICWILWYTWKARNEWIFDHLQPNPGMVIELARKSNCDFWATGVRRVVDPLESRGCDSPGSRWSPPPPSCLKINCDGAFSHRGVDAAVGIICRDSFGFFIWGFVDKVKSISAFMTEALALKRALLLALDLGHDKVVFESDCLPLISCVDAKSPDSYDWQCRSIIRDVIGLLNSRVGFSLTFSPRGGNCAADLLAAEAYKGVCPIGWVSTPAPALLSLLTLEAQEAFAGLDIPSGSDHCLDGG
ncbi:hypothetical protein QN277_008493 [Acacia crassicarpa]|uniref:Reverse transcriptase domain-containing protein n=1 Tax=Acacia crassicarpa TaxID=499986 RepID=A0AAE1IRC9_9FABA|nr:hypothetical protein QN277_008493 [Acacia crassicarpa]